MDYADSAGPSDSELRAAVLKQEIKKREEMFLVRVNFREPTIDRDRRPEWVQLLEEKRKQGQAREEQQMQNCKWLETLHRQRSTDDRIHQQEHPSLRVDETNKTMEHGEFMSGWLRQLRSEQRDYDEEKSHHM